jgi:hypothetical protein
MRWGFRGVLTAPLVIDHPVTVVTTQEQVVLEVDGAVELLETTRRPCGPGRSQDVRHLGRCDGVPVAAGVVQDAPVAQRATTGGLGPERDADARLDARGADFGAADRGWCLARGRPCRGRSGKSSGMSVLLVRHALAVRVRMVERRRRPDPPATVHFLPRLGVCDRALAAAVFAALLAFGLLCKACPCRSRRPSTRPLHGTH